MDVYEIKYTQSVKEQGAKPVSTVFTIPTDDNEIRLSPLNSPWASAGVYAGAVGGNGSLVNVQTVLRFTGWKEVEQYSDMRDCTATRETISGTLNLRFMGVFGTGAVEAQKRSFKWTGLTSERKAKIEDALADNINPGQVLLVYNPYSRTTNTISMTGTSNSPLNLAPLNSLQINNLIWLPLFVIREVEYYNYDAPSDSYGAATITDSVSKTWAEIKPEDKTAAGADYDAELFDKGWKEITATQEDGRRFRYVAAVELVPYYGKCSNTYNPTADTYTEGVNPDDGKTYGDRQILGDTVSDAYPVIGNTSLKRPALCVYAEYYDPTTGSVIYTIPAGLHFLNTAGGGTSYNQYIQPAMSLASTYNKATNTSAATSWTDFWFNNNDYYSNVFKSIQDETTESGDPTTVCPGIAVDFSTSISLVDSSYPTGKRYYINNGPVAYSYNRSTRTNFFNHVTFYSISDLWATIASLGCYVADSRTAARQAPVGVYVGQNNHIYLGEMTAAGTTTGRMIQGSDIQDQPQATIDDIIQNTPYTPITPGPGGGDPSEDGPDKIGQGPGWTGDDTGPRTGYSDLLGFPANMMSLYAMDIGLANSFGSSLWASIGSEQFMDNMWTAVFNTATLDFSECLKYFPVCRMYPINFGSGLYTATDVATLWTPAIYFGRAVSPINLSGSPYRLGSPIIYGGTCSIDVPNAEDWQDLEPYTTAQIYIPYCGQYSVPVADIVGANIHTETYIDILTGEMLVYVVRSKGGLSNTLFTCTGRIGYDVPLTTDSAALKIGALAASVGVPALVAGTLGAATIAVGTGAKAGTAIATKGAGVEEMAAISERQNRIVGDITRGASGASSGISGALNALGANMTGGVTSITSPTMGGMMGINGCPNMVITIKKTRVVTSGLHGSTAAYPLHHSRTLGEMSGLVKCVNPNVSGITATATELSQIANYLESGVIV